MPTASVQSRLAKRRCSRASGAAWLACTAWFALAGQKAVAAHELRCDESAITVHAAAPTDANSVCAAAADAMHFLRAQGLEVNEAFEVFVVEALKPPISASAFGGYINSERRAYLLTFAKIATRGTVFGLPADRTLYRSLAIHEIAHAIAAANFRYPDPPIEADEYIAYATMFATLPDSYRDRLLALYANANFASESEINPLVYVLDPFRFGILAYKHFTQPGNGAAFLRRVLNGDALREFAQ